MITLDHFAIPVHKGAQEEAVRIFSQLGLNLIESRGSDKDWGKVRFMKMPWWTFNWVKLQLTEFSDTVLPQTYPGVHPAFKISSIEWLIERVEKNVAYEIEAEAPGKWFLSLPEITPVQVELIEKKGIVFDKAFLIATTWFTMSVITATFVTNNLLEGLVYGLIGFVVSFCGALGMLILFNRSKKS